MNWTSTIAALAQAALPKELWNGTRGRKWRRLDPDKSSNTILLAQMHRDLSKWNHPIYDRWITAREAGGLRSLHDRFVFHGSERLAIGRPAEGFLTTAVVSG